MRYFNIIIYLLLFVVTKAQYNLAPNPSFEIYTSCPNNAGQLSFATSWFSPTNADTDYFNSCATNIYYGVPNQGTYNYQLAHSGSAYVGIYLYNGINNDYREYCSVQLLNSLIAGKCYWVNFYVNKSSRFYGKYAVNNIGCAFTTTNISSTGTGFVLNIAPSIQKFGNPIISDTINWISVSGVYTANGGENYLTIGNFFNDTNTDTLNTGSGNYPGSGYLIDDFSVIPIDSIIGGMPANAGADKSTTIGDSTFIGQEISNLNCNWYQLPSNTQIATNTSGIYVKPLSPTTYVVEQNLCGTITYDTVKVFASPTTLKDYEALQNSVTIYPNPSDGHISIISKKLSDIVITVTDITGKVLYNEQTKVIASFANFNVNVKAGSYFVTIVNTHTNEKIIKKLMIQ
jgi:hypothetical protein